MKVTMSTQCSSNGWKASMVRVHKLSCVVTHCVLADVNVLIVTTDVHVGISCL